MTLNRKLVLSVRYAVKPSLPIANLIDIKIQSIKDQTKHMDNERIVLRPGFGPGSPTRKAGILDRTILPEHAIVRSTSKIQTLLNKPSPSRSPDLAAKHLLAYSRWAFLV